MRDGSCTCEGFVHRKDCRHVKMVYGRANPVDRSQARKDVQDIIASWFDRWERITLDCYEFADKDEQTVSRVKLKASGAPLQFDGKEYTVISGITSRGTYISVVIE